MIHNVSNILTLLRQSDEDVYEKIKQRAAGAGLSVTEYLLTALNTGAQQFEDLQTAYVNRIYLEVRRSMRAEAKRICSDVPGLVEDDIFLGLQDAADKPETKGMAWVNHFDFSIV